MRAHHQRARYRSIVGSVFTLAIVGCATASQLPQSFSVEQTPSARSTHNLLTNMDLVSTHAVTTVDALMRLRPEFLRGSVRGPLIGQPEIAVYLNLSYVGDVSVLNSVPISAIREISFLHPSEAYIRFGTVCRCANGAIVVTTRLTDR